MTFREVALRESVAIGGTDAEILRRAERFDLFLQGRPPVRLVLTVGPAVSQTVPVRAEGPKREADMAQLHDDQQFDVSVAAKDSKGFDVPDTFSASVADETVATVAAGADGRTFTVRAGLPGSTILTVTDGLLSATLAIDVVPGAVALIQLSVGDPTPQG